MSNIKEYMKRNGLDFDASNIISKDVLEMERPFDGRSLFKFYPDSHFGLLSNPTIRFTQKTKLNDPFELTMRWKEFLSKSTIDGMAVCLKKVLDHVSNDIDYIAENLFDEMRKSGQLPIGESKKSIIRRLKSPEHSHILTNMKLSMNDNINNVLRYMASNRPEFEKILSDRFISQIGIFSATEDVSSDQMWGLYASSGRGFAIEIDPHHPKFCATTGSAAGKTLFRKVYYLDEYADDFLSNPYYLFLIKKSKWGFEKEWRMFRRLSDCDIKDTIRELYLDRLERGMIKK